MDKILESYLRASATATCPSGYVCGFPTSNGDLYGGVLYLQSAAVGPQAQALIAASARWGAGVAGKEQIPMPVCKRKYQPHRRRRPTPSCNGEGEREMPRAIQENEGEDEDLEEMYACHLHHAKRKALIERHGLRDGWEKFDQWHRRRGRTGTLTAEESLSSGGGNNHHAVMRASEADGEIDSADRAPSSSIAASADVGFGLAIDGGTAGERIAGENSGQGRKRPRAVR